MNDSARLAYFDRSFLRVSKERSSDSFGWSLCSPRGNGDVVEQLVKLTISDVTSARSLMNLDEPASY